ncbi:MFS transporter [Acinetobacter sp. MD2(2019)]|uniref:MFS transporter n=1 Tax=Acinetobacter sp. MD2(2019) TaxID=2605273 RepID=UPI002D1EC0FF|nr:MFS transporter [Acinetobacter sp. MD2(2019)]MEB3753347.1 MFS transporter [Acinetobacter sp. MD2(2019)]
MDDSLKVASAADMSQKTTKYRYFILFFIFIITVINYADRSILSITGTSIAQDFNISAKDLGIVFSAFGWAYALGQIPGGWLLDKFGSKWVYGGSLFLWSVCTFMQGFIGDSFFIASIVTSFFILRFILGLVESPAFPANSRIVATWFPTKERGLASSIFNSAQYFATIVFAPLMALIVSKFSWHYVFFAMGLLGMLLSVLWMKTEIHPNKQKRVNQAELDYMKAGGALIDIDQSRVKSIQINQPSNKSIIKSLLSSRMLIGVYIGQYCITALTYFFITWFPIYLIKGRGMSVMEAGMAAVIPAICGFAGGLLGGLISDVLIKRGYSNTVARKTPFVIGMLLATTLILCNFTDTQWVIIALMALAFFGKGLGAVGWAVVSDAAPKEALGLTGGVFNGLGNIAGIITPLVIGYIVSLTGSFEWALYFVAAHSLLALFSYLFIVGKIKRLELKKFE